jgi:hypothetical protein
MDRTRPSECGSRCRPADQRQPVHGDHRALVSPQRTSSTRRFRQRAHTGGARYLSCRFTLIGPHVRTGRRSHWSQYIGAYQIRAIEFDAVISILAKVRNLSWLHSSTPMACIAAVVSLRDDHSNSVVTHLRQHHARRRLALAPGIRNAQRRALAPSGAGASSVAGAAGSPLLGAVSPTSTAAARVVAASLHDEVHQNIPAIPRTSSQ